MWLTLHTLTSMKCFKSIASFATIFPDIEENSRIYKEKILLCIAGKAVDSLEAPSFSKVAILRDDAL